MANKTRVNSFWKYLDVLWMIIMKIVAVTIVFGIIVFLKEKLFDNVFVPKSDKFVIYRLLNRMALWARNIIGPFSIRLINTSLAQQFVIRIKTALCADVLCTSSWLFADLGFLLAEFLCKYRKHTIVKKIA